MATTTTQVSRQQIAGVLREKREGAPQETGGGLLVTGGTVVGQHEISAKEERGTAIRHGVRHRRHAGDVVVIPKNQPHWFQDVSGR